MLKNLVIKKEGNEWCLYTKDGEEKLGCHPTKEEAEAQERAIHVGSRRFAASILTSEIRTAMFQDREHLVVPVIALVEGVIHAVNSDNPELVLVSELAVAPQGWNGRPVIGNHPKDRIGPVSANEPEILEKVSFGMVFNTHIDGKKLKMEAWLDPKRIEKIGPDAIQILERVRSREMVEVSVGAFVTTEEKSGVFGGKHYDAIWRNIVPDHLAFLPEGIEGACSVEMGCGAPRAAEEGVMDGEKPQRSIRERVMNLLGLKTNLEIAEDVSDSDLRNLLDQALYAEEPAYLGINDVFPDDNLVVYAVAPDDKLLTLRRSYKTNKEGAVTLKDDREEVRAVTRYEPVTAQANLSKTFGAKKEDVKMTDKKIDEKKAEQVRALIGDSKTPWIKEDQEYLESVDDERLKAFEAPYVPDEIKTDEKKIERVRALIENEKNLWIKEDQKYLESLSDERLSALEALDEPKPESKPKLEPKTIEEWMTEAPEEIRKVVTDARTAEAKKKTNLITSLREATKEIYTDDELNKMSSEQLTKLIHLAKVPEPRVDYSGQGLPRSEDENKVPDPPKILEKLNPEQKK